MGAHDAALLMFGVLASTPAASWDQREASANRDHVRVERGGDAEL